MDPTPPSHKVNPFQLCKLLRHPGEELKIKETADLGSAVVEFAGWTEKILLLVITRRFTLMISYHFWLMKKEPKNDN